MKDNSSSTRLSASSASRSSFSIEDASMPQNCKACGNTSLSPVLRISNVPVVQNLLVDSVQGALNCVRGNVRLGFCDRCGYIGNCDFDIKLVDYSTSYENTQTHSPSFQKYIQNLAHHLVDTYGLRDKTVLEIGCGKGHFLKEICSLGNNEGIGFDPSFVETGGIEHKKLRVIGDYYSEKYRDYKADLICCRHVLEHIDGPLSFLQTVRAAIGQNLETVVFFEVPSIEWILDNVVFFDLFYEHCNYFSDVSLRNIFRQAAFGVTSIRRVFGGQYLWLEAVPTATTEVETDRDEPAIRELQNKLSSFLAQLTNKVQWINEMIDAELAQGKRPVFWGAGAKGVTLLNMLGLDLSKLTHVVDVNPRKHGSFIAGTGQSIVGSVELHKLDPGTIFVTNPNYVDEIQSMVSSMGLNPRLISV